MNFGLSNDQFEILRTLVIQPLKAKHAEVYIFGSRARGKHHPFSDIDILFKDVHQLISMSEISNIKESIENSKLAIKVDLVNAADLAESYRQSVDAEKILV